VLLGRLGGDPCAAASPLPRELHRPSSPPPAGGRRRRPRPPPLSSFFPSLPSFLSTRPAHPRSVATCHLASCSLVASSRRICSHRVLICTSSGRIRGFRASSSPVLEPFRRRLYTLGAPQLHHVVALRAAGAAVAASRALLPYVVPPGVCGPRPRDAGGRLCWWSGRPACPCRGDLGLPVAASGFPPPPTPRGGCSPPRLRVKAPSNCWANYDGICGRRSPSGRRRCEVLGPVARWMVARRALRVGVEAKAFACLQTDDATPAGALSSWSIIRSPPPEAGRLVGVVSLPCSCLCSTLRIVTSVAWVLADALPPCRLVRGWWSWSRRMLCRRCSEAC
jgi:hypothetical protein